MQLEPSKNINNYKGVMLCSRPNQAAETPVERPFCARVVPPDQLGLVPVKKTIEIKPPRNHNPIVDKHKKWLEEFKLKQLVKKQQHQQKTHQEQEKFLRIRQQAEQDRERAKVMKNQYKTISSNVLNILDEPVNDAPVAVQSKKSGTAELNAENLRKLNELSVSNNTSELPPINPNNTNKDFKKKKAQKQKPAWAITQKEAQRMQEEEVDDLLDFFENTDVEQFIEDTEVNAILKSLKQKIQNMKKEQNWKEKQMVKAKKKQIVDQGNNENDNSDLKSHVSGRSEGGKSVASEKSTKRVEELKEKLEKKNQGIEEWDKYSKTSKSSFANLEDRIAKNVADEVLRSYGNFKGVHSNQSIRKLLEREAARQLMEPHPRPIITTVVKEKSALDMNTLPYLHRNPAI